MPAAARRGSRVAADLRVELGGGGEGCGRRHQARLQGLQQSAPRGGGGGAREGQQVSCKWRHLKQKAGVMPAVQCTATWCLADGQHAAYLHGSAPASTISARCCCPLGCRVELILHDHAGQSTALPCTVLWVCRGAQGWHLHAPAVRDVAPCCTAQVAAMHGPCCRR